MTPFARDSYSEKDAFVCSTESFTRGPFIRSDWFLHLFTAELWLHSDPHNKTHMEPENGPLRED